MMQASTILSNENATDPRTRKKGGVVDRPKGARKGLKALQDVKNTLHSQVSRNNDTDKRNVIKKKNAFSKSIKLADASPAFKSHVDSIHEVDDNRPALECPNHHLCESSERFDMFEEFRLNKKELSLLTNRMRFFGMDKPPVKIVNTPISSFDDIELCDLKFSAFESEDLGDDFIPCEIPEPVFEDD